MTIAESIRAWRSQETVLYKAPLTLKDIECTVRGIVSVYVKFHQEVELELFQPPNSIIRSPLKYVSLKNKELPPCRVPKLSSQVREALALLDEIPKEEKQ